MCKTWVCIMVWAGGVTATVTLHVVVVGEGGVSGAESRRWQPYFMHMGEGGCCMGGGCRSSLPSPTLDTATVTTALVAEELRMAARRRGR